MHHCCMIPKQQRDVYLNASGAESVWIIDVARMLLRRIARRMMEMEMEMEMELKMGVLVMPGRHNLMNVYILGYFSSGGYNVDTRTNLFKYAFIVCWRLISSYIDNTSSDSILIRWSEVDRQIQCQIIS